MKTLDFIRQAIGQKVYLTPNGDLAINGELRHFIFHKTPLTLIELTKGGVAIVQDEQGKFQKNHHSGNVFWFR
jgi:hypothetical protein